MRDNGSIVLGWLTKLIVVFAVLGVLAYDGVMLVVANFGAADDATVAASAAADSFHAHKDLQAAYDAAVMAVSDKDDTIQTDTFQVDASGRITLTVERRPVTLWMHRIGPLKKWTVVHQTGSGTSIS